MESEKMTHATHENLIQAVEDYKQSLLMSSKISEEELNTLIMMATKNERIRIANELLVTYKSKPANTIIEKFNLLEVGKIITKLFDEC